MLTSYQLKKPPKTSIMWAATEHFNNIFPPVSLNFDCGLDLDLDDVKTKLYARYLQSSVSSQVIVRTHRNRLLYLATKPVRRRVWHDGQDDMWYGIDDPTSLLVGRPISSCVTDSYMTMLIVQAYTQDASLYITPSVHDPSIPSRPRGVQWRVNNHYHWEISPPGHRLSSCQSEIWAWPIW